MNASSRWRKVEDRDAIGQEEKHKLKVLASASGHVTPIVMHVHGFPDKDLKVPLQ